MAQESGGPARKRVATCQVRRCPLEGFRVLKWKAKAAGESVVCRDHFFEYEQKFARLLEPRL